MGLTIGQVMTVIRIAIECSRHLCTWVALTEHLDLRQVIDKQMSQTGDSKPISF